MPFQHSPSERQKISWARAQAVLTTTQRVPLDRPPAAPQLRAHLDQGPIMEGAALFRKKGRVKRRSRYFSGIFENLTGISKIIFNGLVGDD
ncbi:hypothetical protein O181_023173 [Austropuccinia psidii MF-1]|uniref:Uncharacterized protein n=1 Tax=Austropuccinia psidii MF-1 TaxID=1389203 RepID=A0A9Q3GX20_9BASI|nr:hypothetical protein [Austropuccinia psidii MF-1]